MSEIIFQCSAFFHHVGRDKLGTANGGDDDVYLCTPTDVIGQSVEINCATVNDYIVIEKSGAYGLTYSPHSFLCHRLPKEILYDNNECYEINNCDNGLKY